MSCGDREHSVPDGFQIMEGFELTLVASEPLIADPVDIEFDHNNDAYVLEMPGYPFEDQQSRIIKLIDSDNDGIYEDRIIYAENLQLASSILPYQNGMLVAAPPYLLHIKDTNKDGTVDHRDTLMGGFSTGNLQHNYNGLTYGMDNWIYAANGGNSGAPYWWGDTSTTIDLRGDDIRLDLEKKVIERIGYSSGGFELGMDEYGRIYETHNLEHISHLVFPSSYIQDHSLLVQHTLENISDHEEDGLARIYPIGEQESRVNHPEQSGYFSGACGITYYGGGNMDQLNGSVWIADVVLNLIHLDQLSPKGASFTASRVGEKRDFLASTDRSFRPVNMTVAPDGSMYIVDMYRKVIEHPEWIPDEIEKTLDLDAGKDKGRIYRVSSTKSSHDSYDFKNINGLIKSLGHDNQWVRNAAHRLIMEKERNEETISRLKKILISDNDYQRLHARWILSNNNELSDNEIIDGLNDAVSGNRENILKIAERKIDKRPELISKIIELLNDRDQRVRMQAALTLSALNRTELQVRKSEIIAQLSSAIKKPIDKWNIASLTLLATPFINEVLDLAIKLDDSDMKNEFIRSLALVSSHSDGDILNLISTISGDQINNNLKTEIINALEPHNSKLSKSPRLISALSKIEARSDLPLLAAIAGFRKKLSLPVSEKFEKAGLAAIEKVQNKQLDIEERITNLKLLEHLPYSQKKKALYNLTSNAESIGLQEASLLQIWNANDPEIGQELVKRWKTMGPKARKHASDILLYKEAHHDALLTALEDDVINIGEMNFDLERRRTLLWWTDNEDTKERAQNLFSDAGVVNRKDAIDRMSDALDMSGNIQDGEMVYNTLCAQCHVYKGNGNDVGPVLTEINRKSKESLIHDILDPNAAVDTRYINHKVETKDGKLMIGIVDIETDQTITLKNSGGIVNTIQKDDIKSFESLGTSLMMEGLEGNMSHEDMADLLAYLLQ